MDKIEMTQTILQAKKSKGLTWETIAAKIGMSELWVASCCYGENSMTAETADKLCTVLDLGADVRDALLEFPTRATAWRASSSPPTRCYTASTRSCACTANP